MNKIQVLQCNTYRGIYLDWEGCVFITVNDKAHVCSIRLGTEEYGWLVRYCEKNDMSMSAAIRKALNFYRGALVKSK